MRPPPMPVRATRPRAVDRTHGAPASLDDLYRDYAHYVAWFANRLLGRSDEADDLVHDVFVAIASTTPPADPAAIRRWIKAITVRRALNRLRWRRVRARFGVVRAGRYDAVDPAASPDDRALVAEIHAVMERLRPKDRVAWLLRHVEGESLEDVAAICGCSLATAKRRIAAAHQRIRETLGGV